MRFIVHAAAVLIVFAAAITHSLAQSSEAELPAAWDGVWRGEIEVLAGGKVTHRAQMELRIAPIAGSAAKTWTQTYSGQPPRQYEIRPADSGAGRFILDEKNGVLLEEQLIGDTLLSTFRTGDVLLFSRFDLRGDALAVEIATFAAPAVNGATKPEVGALPFRSIQRGVLHRQPPDAAVPTLGADAKLTFTFPELPNTLAGMVTGKTKTAELSVILPSNYTREGKHPLFVYLKGGSGGPEDGGAMAREIVGAENFIAVQMPLFKKNQPKGQTLPVTLEDMPIVSAAYRAMLEKLAATVPNIDWERSVIGGHSNGAHTLGVLLAGNDEFITQYFRAFWFHEGGFTLLPAFLRDKDRRFLVLMADDGMTGTSEFRQLMLDQMALNERQAKLMKADFTAVTMRGYGHDVPPEYMRNVRQFARREPIEDITATAQVQAAKLTLPLRTHPDSSAWNDLLIGDLTNMKVPGNIWSYADGILTATKDENIWTKATHGDCVLDLEFKMEPGANGGVFLYNSDEKNWMPTSVEIQICDDTAPQWKEKPATWHCGAFFGHKAPTRSSVKPAGEWNRMTITSQGPRVTVVLNDEIVNEINLAKFTDAKLNPNGSEVPSWLQGKPWSELPKQGRIGFQGRHAGAGIEFRHVKLLRLPRPQ